MSLPRPTFCLVTDRRRLAARLALPPAGEAALDALVDQVGLAAEAGIDLVQIREGDLDSRTLGRLVRRILAVAGDRTRVVVNDRLDVALASGAAGVHLREVSVPADRVRRTGPPGLLIGRSLHEVAEVASARSVDYVAFGTVFPTRSKPAGHETAGPAGLRAASAATSLPVLGIGGIGLENVRSVALAGAAGVAAVDLFLPPSGDAAPGWLHEIVANVRAAFDSSGSVS
jgi:thiamine-phosphate pyrophosphorylase